LGDKSEEIKSGVSFCSNQCKRNYTYVVICTITTASITGSAAN